MIRET